MCGIYGYNWNNTALARRISTAMVHRGPDDRGIYETEGLTLGHRRLSILDLSRKGHQPMSTPDGAFTITYNGEVFNYQELKAGLKARFRSRTDTEVLLYAYKKDGIKFLERLNGQFAFCIYDRRRGELLLARDRVGINPLYYYEKDGTFLFGSELKAILLSDVEKRIDEQALHHYLLYGYTPRGQSILRHCKKLNPGHYLIYNLRERRITAYKAYWRPRITHAITDEDVAKERLLELLDKAVERRLLADVPVGAFLSGGLDSSAIVALMSKRTQQLNTFSITFDYPDYDEAEYAAIVSKRFKTKHHVIRFTAKDVAALIEQLPEHYDEPFGDHSLIPTFLVAKVARQHVTVALSGDGGDELFGGYEKYQLFRLVDAMNKPLLKPFLKALSHLPAPTKARRYLRYARLERHEQYANLNSYAYVDEMTTDDRKAYSGYKRYFHHDHWLDNATEADLNLYLPDDILTKVDRASLGNSLESRPPFLDPELVDFALSLDPYLKIRGAEGKWILKKAMEGILPDEIIWRKKKGFGSPLKHYFRHELKGLLAEILKPQHSCFEGLGLERLYTAHIEGRADYSRILFSALMFNRWWQRWMR